MSNPKPPEWLLERIRQCIHSHLDYCDGRGFICTLDRQPCRAMTEQTCKRHDQFPANWDH